MGINSWLEDELYRQYLRDHSAVDESWKHVFEENGGARPAEETIPLPNGRGSDVRGADAAPEAVPAEWQPLRGAAGRIAENMAASVSVPLATSQRIIAVKVMDENRRIINQHRVLIGQSKVSYTHIIGWAVVKALQSIPGLNHAYAEKDGQGFRVARQQVNLGIAVDTAGKDGARSLLVPNIKNAGAMNFQQYLEAFDDLVARARTARLTPVDFQGTTISLTNPGTVGTMASNPRLMVGQGAIIATGAIDYPAEYRGAAEETRAVLGISKVMGLGCTYDHRIIQGAESGAFLAKVQELLDGKADFYEEIFANLRMPHQPVHWETDRQPQLPGLTATRHAEIAKEAGIMQLINAYRVRGHLIADLDPLGAEPSYHPELDPETYGLTIWDLDREFLTGSLGEAIGEGGPKPVATLREILETLRETYCGKIGCEYMNIQVPEQKRWLQQRMEPASNHWPLDRERRVRILRNLIAAEEFEHFLHSRFVGQKRFALEGAETAAVILEEILERAAANNVAEIVIGMAHRGRLNILANIVGKDVKQIFSEFEGEIDPASTQGSGDVKYHLGAQSVRKTESGREIAGFGLAQPEPPGSGGPGGGRHRAAEAGPPGRHRPRARDSGAGARRRGLRRPGRGGGDAEPFAARRLLHRRHHPPDHQQPDRVHHPARRIALDAIFHRRRARCAGAHFPRQRRQPAGGDARGADRLRLPPEVQEGRGDRHDLLPPPRPQRRRRSQLHAAAALPQDQGTPRPWRCNTARGWCARAWFRARKWRPCARKWRSAFPRRSTPCRTRPSATRCRN